MTGVFWIAGMVTCAGAYALVIQSWRHKIEQFWGHGAFAAGNALFMIAAVTERNRGLAVYFTAAAILSALVCRFFWRRRKHRGRLAAMGAKSRARIAAMVTRMRERPARPALRPVPAGAR